MRGRAAAFPGGPPMRPLRPTRWVHMLPTWWQRRYGKTFDPTWPPRRRWRPLLEVLEARTLLSLSFTPAPGSPFPVGSGPLVVAVADLTGKGKLDIVAANIGGAYGVSVLLGNGDGTFQSQRTFATGLEPFGMTVADVNGDSKPDIVTANQQSNNMSVLLGNGDGTFQPQQTFAVGPGPFWVAAGDINGDGKPDLVVANGSNDTVGV